MALNRTKAGFSTEFRAGITPNILQSQLPAPSFPSNCGAFAPISTRTS
jgi:hypothetical protein